MPRKYEKVQDLLPVVKDMAEAGYTYRQIAGKLGLGGKEVIEELLKRERRKAAHGVVRKMSQEEALKRIVTEYPEYTTQAIQNIKDGVDLVEILSLLDSY